MEKKSEDGEINSSNEENKVLKFKEISELNFDDIKSTFDNLADDQLIILKLPDDKINNTRVYKEIRVQKCNTVNHKIYYNVSLFRIKGGKKTLKNQGVHFEKENHNMKLRFVFSKLSAKINPLYTGLEKIKSYPIDISISNFDLYLSTINTEEKSKEIQKYYTQVIAELNQKYKKKFLSFKNNIVKEDFDKITRLIKELRLNNTIVFIFHNLKYRTTNYKEISIVRTDKVHYYIHTISNEGVEKNFNGKGVSMKSSKYSSMLRIYDTKKKGREEISTSILFSDVYISTMDE